MRVNISTVVDKIISNAPGGGMRPHFTFLGVFWGVTIIGERFCAFCDLVRTFFIAFGTFLVALFW